MAVNEKVVLYVKNAWEKGTSPTVHEVKLWCKNNGLTISIRDIRKTLNSLGFYLTNSFKVFRPKLQRQTIAFAPGSISVDFWFDEVTTINRSPAHIVCCLVVVDIVTKLLHVEPIRASRRLSNVVKAFDRLLQNWPSSFPIFALNSDRESVLCGKGMQAWFRAKNIKHYVLSGASASKAFYSETYIRLLRMHVHRILRFTLKREVRLNFDKHLKIIKAQIQYMNRAKIPLGPDHCSKYSPLEITPLNLGIYLEELRKVNPLKYYFSAMTMSHSSILNMAKFRIGDRVRCLLKSIGLTDKIKLSVRNVSLDIFEILQVRTYYAKNYSICFFYKVLNLRTNRTYTMTQQQLVKVERE
jgi:hypothetical protein